MPGSMRQRGENSWNLRVYAGRDPGHRSQDLGRANRPRQQARGLQGARCHGGRGRPAAGRDRPGRGRWPPSVVSGSTHASPSFSPKTVETTRMYIEDPIIPLLGSIQVSKLTPADLDRFYRQLLEVGRSRGPYAPATIRRVHGIIRRALTQGVRWGWITHNPAIDASPPRVPMKELKPPDPDQVVQLFRLAQEADPELATFIMLAASSGARRGELLALRWSDIDLDRGRMSIERGIVRVGDDLIEQGTKTHQSRRISLDAGTVAALRAHQERMMERAAAASLSSHPRASCSAMPSMAHRRGIPTRRRERFGGSVSKPGSRAFVSMISGTTWRHAFLRLVLTCVPSPAGWVIGIRARPSTCIHTSSQKLIKKQRRRSDESSRMPPTIWRRGANSVNHRSSNVSKSAINGRHFVV